MARLTRREEIDNCPGIWVQEGFANEGLQTWFNGYDEGYSAINKCAEYEDAEEQGLLVNYPEAKASGLPVSATTVIITPKWQFSRNLHRRFDNRHACYQVWDVPSLPKSMYRLKKIRDLSLLFLGFWQH